MKYRFIAGHKDEFPIQALCRVLAVSSSGYYAWRNRPASARAKSNQVLLEQIKQAHQASRATYGSPRIHAELRAQGVLCSSNRVARLMRQHGIRVKRRKRRQSTTDSRHDYPVAPNWLNQDFTAMAPNRKWLADITYIDTWEGWLYLAVVLDVFSRRIVGWAMAEHRETPLVEQALQMALLRRKPAADLLHHSDRGSQYASHDYQALLAIHQIQVSMSRKGNCYDNAMLESFIGTLKTECGVDRYETRRTARGTIFEYIEVWYNRQRRHSALHYCSPAEYEQLYVDSVNSVSTKPG